MPRIARVAPGGFVYHIFNRANGRLRLFRKGLFRASAAAKKAGGSTKANRGGRGSS